MFLQVCGCVHGGEYLTRYTPGDQVHPPGTRCPPRDQVHPPGPGTPPLGPGTPPDQVHPFPQDQVHPPGPGPPTRDQGDTVYARTVHILLECNLVSKMIFMPDKCFMCNKRRSYRTRTHVRIDMLAAMCT